MRRLRYNVVYENGTGGMIKEYLGLRANYDGAFPSVFKTPDGDVIYLNPRFVVSTISYEDPEIEPDYIEAQYLNQSHIGKMTYSDLREKPGKLTALYVDANGWHLEIDSGVCEDPVPANHKVYFIDE